MNKNHKKLYQLKRAFKRNKYKQKNVSIKLNKRFKMIKVINKLKSKKEDLMKL